MSNEAFFRNLLERFPNLNDLEFKDNTLIYQNQTIKLDNIHLDTFFRQNTNLTHNLYNLTSKEVFNIIANHCRFNIKEKNYLNLDENIIIKGMRVINHKNENGLISNYIYLIDEQEKSYIDSCDYAIEAFNYYNQNNSEFNQITVRMINEYLKQFKNNEISDEKEIIKLYEIKDYLLSPLKEKLDLFLEKMKELELKDNKTLEEQKLLSDFKEFSNISKNANMQRKLKAKAGYLNGLVIIALVTTLGIILSVLLVKGLR